MRIDSSTIVNIATRRNTGTNADAAAKSGSGSGAVVVDLGVAASQTKGSNGIPDDVARRLEEVRVQLAEGSYELNFGALAEQIADEELARSGGG